MLAPRLSLSSSARLAVATLQGEADLGSLREPLAAPAPLLLAPAAALGSQDGPATSAADPDQVGRWQSHLSGGGLAGRMTAERLRPAAPGTNRDGRDDHRGSPLQPRGIARSERDKVQFKTARANSWTPETKTAS